MAIKYVHCPKDSGAQQRDINPAHLYQRSLLKNDHGYHTLCRGHRKTFLRCELVVLLAFITYFAYNEPNLGVNYESGINCWHGWCWQIGSSQSV